MKRNCFEALYLQSVPNNKIFWKMVGPFFSSKSKEAIRLYYLKVKNQLMTLNVPTFLVVFQLHY